MKFNKIFLPVAAVASLFAASCTDEVKYTPAEPAPVTKYYFPTSNPDTQDLVDGTTYFTVTVARAEAGAEETVQINSSTDGNFSIPESVTFAEDQAITNLRVSYNLDNIEINTHYTVTLELPGIENTPYSYGKLDIDVLYLPWEDFEEDESMGWYRDGFISGLFNTPADEYQRKIQKHPTTPGIYRVVNPYAEDVYPYYFQEEEPRWLEEDCYMVIDASDPEKVTIPRFNLGPLYNNIPFIGVSFNLAVAEPDPNMYGKLKDGVITFPKNALVFGLYMNASDDSYSLYQCNAEETFRVVLPGYEKPTEWVGIGLCEFTDGFYGKYLLGDDYQPEPYKVYVEQHMQEQGQFRIVDPYSVYGEAAEGGDDYFYIDAANEDCVFWKYDTGKTSGMAPLYCGTYGDYLLDNEKATAEEIESSECAGFFVDNVFTVKGEYAGVYSISRRALWRASNVDVKLDISDPEEVVEGDAEAKRFNGKRTMTKNAVKTNIQLAR